MQFAFKPQFWKNRENEFFLSRFVSHLGLTSLPALSTKITIIFPITVWNKPNLRNRKRREGKEKVAGNGNEGNNSPCPWRVLYIFARSILTGLLTSYPGDNERADLHLQRVIRLFDKWLESLALFDATLRRWILLRLENTKLGSMDYWTVLFV